MQPGLKTSEFYVTLGSMIASLLVMSGLIAPEKTGEVQEVIVQAIGGLVALGTVVAYIYSRTTLKRTELETQVKG